VGRLALSFALCFTVAVAGARISTAALPTWYPTLKKPPWTPPARVFGPVWSVLYALMAAASWLVWERASGGWRAPAMRWYWVQLGLNLGWTVVFFGWRRPGPALVEMLALWTAIVITIRGFGRVSRPAALLMIPYLGWVTLALALNFAIWRRNRAVLARPRGDR
jgi:tryptophan-rich sensory protein